MVFTLYTEEPDGLWIMDYGFPGFEIHQIHNPWILDGFGFTKEIHEIREFRSTILIIRNDDKLIIYYTIYLMDFMDLISAFHMDLDLDWIWIYELVENGLWIGFGL